MMTERLINILSPFSFKVVFIPAFQIESDNVKNRTLNITVEVQSNSFIENNLWPSIPGLHISSRLECHLFMQFGSRIVIKFT